MASSSKRTVDIKKCPIWIYGPQVSEKNANYSVGGETWEKIHEQCKDSIKKMYLPRLTPTIIFGLLSDQDRSEELKLIVLKGLKMCRDILDVLVIHAAFINALGIDIANKNTLVPGVRQTLQYRENRIAAVYQFLYEETEKILVDKGSINIFVTPAQFIQLRFTTAKRPKNIVISYISNKNNQNVEDVHKINTDNSVSYTHPITPAMRKCATNMSVDCTVRFEEIKDSLFKPLANVIACHCSFFKQRLQRIKSPLPTLYDLENVDKISVGDYESFMRNNQSEPMMNISPPPPILIKKYKDTDTTCEKKTYLSQLFEKVCMFLYKPHYVTPTTDTYEDLLAAAKTNYEIGKYAPWGYSSYISKIFQTPILQKNAANLEANIQVFFIIGDAGQQETLYLDFYSGPPMQFFTGVLQEIYENEIFKPTETFFNNQRYELNTKFDIAKLECYKNLPDALKTPELKEELTEHFFLVIGNIIHFAVANNLELPFKLSRIYIMKLFKMFDFTDIDTLLKPENLKQQLLFISTYLLEKAPSSYTNELLKIFKDPEMLKNAEIIDIFDFDLPASKRAKGITMNGSSVLVEPSKNFHIYSEDKAKMFLNMIEYLCRTGLKHYFGDLNSEIPVVPGSFKLHPNLEMFFKGYEYTKNFRIDQLYPMRCLDFAASPFDVKMGAIRKVDIYLSGFGITYEVIKDLLIPLIEVGYQQDTRIFPLKFFNTDGVFKSDYISGTSIDGSMSAALTNKLFDLETEEQAGRLNYGTGAKVKMAFILYRVLLNKGKDIPKEFIAQYNQKYFNVPYDINTTELQGNMTNEDYHNEFVKILVKAWTGTPAISYKRFKITIDINAKKLPQTHTCFNVLDINRDYKLASEMYKELVMLATDGSNFGEVLVGGKKKKKK